MAYRKLCLDKEKITVQNAQIRLYKMLKNAKNVNKCEKAFDIYWLNVIINTYLKRVSRKKIYKNAKEEE